MMRKILSIISMLLFLHITSCSNIKSKEKKEVKFDSVSQPLLPIKNEQKINWDGDEDEAYMSLEDCSTNLEYSRTKPDSLEPLPINYKIFTNRLIDSLLKTEKKIGLVDSSTFILNNHLLYKNENKSWISFHLPGSVENYQAKRISFKSNTSKFIKVDYYQGCYGSGGGEYVSAILIYKIDLSPTLVFKTVYQEGEEMFGEKGYTKEYTRNIYINESGIVIGDLKKNRHWLKSGNKGGVTLIPEGRYKFVKDRFQKAD